MNLPASRRRALDVVFQTLSVLCVSILLLRKSRNAEHAGIAEEDETKKQMKEKEELILRETLIPSPLRSQRSLRFNSSSS